MKSAKSLKRSLLVMLIITHSLTNGIYLFASDWPQWRGPNRDGISKEAGLIKTWSEKGPRILWRITIGDGYSAISAANGRVFTMWTEEEDEYLYCLDASTGSKLWQYRVGPIFHDSYGNGPRSAPTIDKDLVYVIGAKGHFHAVRAKNGKRVWSHDLVQEYGTEIPRWGYSCSPLIEKNLVVTDVGGKGDHAFMAFDKRNGNVIWNSQTDTLSYSSPLAVNIHNQRQIIFFNRSGLHALSPTKGDLLWQYEWKESINIATPIFIAPDKIFISCSYEKGAALLKLENREARHNVETVWTKDVMKNHINSSVLVGDHLYGFDNVVLKCIVAETGEQKWSKRRLGRGSLIYSDGQLIVLSERGKLILIEANPERYVETASFQVLKGRCWTPPSLADGLLFLRNREEMVCLDLNREERPEE